MNHRDVVDNLVGEPGFGAADKDDILDSDRDRGRLPDGVGVDSPLRLEVAVKLAFPMGGLTVSGLRKEIARGRLKAEVIAGKFYTTLANIDGMRALCRVPAKGRVSESAQRGGEMDGSSPRQSGSSRTVGTYLHGMHFKPDSKATSKGGRRSTSAVYRCKVPAYWGEARRR